MFFPIENYCTPWFLFCKTKATRVCQISFGEPSDSVMLEVVALSTKLREGRNMNCSIAGWLEKSRCTGKDIFSLEKSMLMPLEAHNNSTSSSGTGALRSSGSQVLRSSGSWVLRSAGLQVLRSSGWVLRIQHHQPHPRAMTTMPLCLPDRTGAAPGMDRNMAAPQPMLVPGAGGVTRCPVRSIGFHGRQLFLACPARLCYRDQHISAEIIFAFLKAILLCVAETVNQNAVAPFIQQSRKPDNRTCWRDLQRSARQAEEDGADCS